MGLKMWLITAHCIILGILFGAWQESIWAGCFVTVAANQLYVTAWGLVKYVKSK